MTTQPLTYTVTDLVTAARCEYAAIRRFELRQGWRLLPCGARTAQQCEDPDCPTHHDALSERLTTLGDTFERTTLEELLTQHGTWTPGSPGGLLNCDTLDPVDLPDIVERAITDGVNVIYQLPVVDGPLRGRADFLIRQPDGTYALCDSKLSRTAQPTAILQITAYADALTRAGLPISRIGHLMLGSGTTTSHSVTDIAPIWRRLRERYQHLMETRTPDAPVTWETGQPPPGVTTCGRCAECDQQLHPARDVLLAMGVTTTHRARLHRAGITTVDALAALHPEPANPHLTVSAQDASRIGINQRTLTRLAAQAALYRDGENTPPPGLLRIIDPAPFTLLRDPDEGDIFFDFEGDPLHTEPGSHDWGLEYLFGWTTRTLQANGQPQFQALWAHSRTEERHAFEQFIDYLTDRVTTYPHMHVYHYAPYETAALKRLAVRHATREDELDALLRAGIFVDLYAVVRGALRTSGTSLSIKKLEPFYAQRLGALREGVTNAGDSIVEYAEARSARDAGDHTTFTNRLRLIEDYNHYDCASTYHLYHWLIDLADEHNITWRRPQTLTAAGDNPDGLDLSTPSLNPADAPEPGSAPHVATRLRTHIDTLTHAWHSSLATNPNTSEPPELTVARMAWAGIDYNRRENKQYWWSHFARLADPVDEWSGGDTFVAARGEVLDDWHRPTARSAPTRTVRLIGDLQPGNKLTEDTKVYTVYDSPAPIGLKTSETALRAWNSSSVEITDVAPDQVRPSRAAVTITEKLPKGVEPFTDIPVGLAPPAPISTAAIDAQLLAFAVSIADALDQAQTLPDTARTRLLLRQGSTIALADFPERSSAITACLERDDPAVVAVQGPPGAGKTYVASHIIASLARRGWNIAVVAQSHAVIENVLSAVLKRSPDLEGRIAKKAPAGGELPQGITAVEPAQIGGFYQENSTQGVIVGGTAWQLSRDDFAPQDGWDLVVIDEAGQYSLANSLAVTHATRRVLLLGDPQQLPQVSQGVHPEPIDESALAWLVDGQAILSPDRGFFLDETWRMHPDLTAPVSQLSYSGRLRSVPQTAQRFVEGLAPGLYGVALPHEGNVGSSAEEADAIVALIRHLIGRAWQPDEREPQRPVEPGDVIVVAPYNAQVQLLRSVFEHAGLSDVRVGTVDKFQGQEAPIAVLSLTTSSADDAPRGLEFVRNRNRLNVSISRGQHSAFVVYSPALLEALPLDGYGMEEHGAFLRLLGEAHVWDHQGLLFAPEPPPR